MTGPTQYRMTPENELQIEVRLASTGVTAAGTYTFGNTLAAPYLPLATILEPAITNTSATLSTSSRPRFFLSTLGVAQIILPEGLTAGQSFQCHARFPLDI